MIFLELGPVQHYSPSEKMGAAATEKRVAGRRGGRARAPSFTRLQSRSAESLKPAAALVPQIKQGNSKINRRTPTRRLVVQRAVFITPGCSVRLLGRLLHLPATGYLLLPCVCCQVSS